MKRSIPSKPQDVTWTDDQWKAIMAKGQDILVAAAAGSGKTAVLVERIIKKIIDDEDPIDVDELLVVTFTNASAAEMRHRIGNALEKEINNHPNSSRLRRQLNLLNKASISTLHSFCLEVIRKYYYLIDIDPSFRIADSTEADLLRDEVLDELFEDEYGNQNNEPFYKAVDTFTNDRSDSALQDLIQKLYEFSRSHPFPNRWLDDVIAMYSVDETTEIDSLPFMDVLRFDIQLQLQAAKEMLEEAYEMTLLPGGPSPRAENYLDDLAIIERLVQASECSWQKLYEEMNAWNFSRAKSCRGDDFDKELVKLADDLRKNAKKVLDKLKEELFSRKPTTFLKDLREMKDVIATLVELTKKFSIRFANVKTEKALVDFSDLEHYCLQILSDPYSKPGEPTPSLAADEYRKQFKEVFVDEYQDTNMVQETILNLVTSDTEHDGNLFMVGDVKQSIYRFRLAEPNLFLSKYNRFTSEGEETGLRIDLSQNFRSRFEVLAGTNFLFKQIMGTAVGEIEYDKQAELVKGASYPEDESYPVELVVINQADEIAAEDDDNESMSDDFDKVELEQSQLEARFMARKIKRLIEEKEPIFNPKTGTYRPIQYRDIVILLRSMPWAPEIMEQFKLEGIPIYANLSTGYFDATEISIMLSLLRVIDNPYQDIPIASVLRSPICGLDEEDLSIIRIQSKQGTFYEALKNFTEIKPAVENEELHEKLSIFIEKLNNWRRIARQGALSDLIWQLYRDTNFFDFVGGLPGGKQRQANLRAFYDRARQYEATSFRGLFRFLRFIERMQERGNDLGTARALSEQEDVVKLMTIHSSKGLEFPVVFVAGLSRKFNMMDINHSYLFDKEFGFASKYVNADKRITYPSLPQLAFKRKKKLETISEEMRVLYVALTRAKEKLILVGSVKNAEKAIKKWGKTLNHTEWLLKDSLRAQASSYLDWIGPALIRHHCSEDIYIDGLYRNPLISDEIILHPSSWHVEILEKGSLVESTKDHEETTDDWLDIIKAGKTINIHSEQNEDIFERLTYQYPHQSSTVKRSKQSVSELKRLYEIKDESASTDIIRKYNKPIMNRPRFMREKFITPAERGTAMHMVMQHIPFDNIPTKDSLQGLLEVMVRKELLTMDQMNAIDTEQILRFFSTEIGRQMLEAQKIQKEVPFSMAIDAGELYANEHFDTEKVLVQGVIDCIFENNQGIYLLDYKTDGIHDRFKGGFDEAKPILENRYRVQIDLYERAITQILEKEVAGKYLYFFDGGHLISM
ncbi:helicase-exonuclease AddAB subunit AddA [Heyndrickxia sp. NPDC080065]|uniref:helicase-exonuclease AddAB subunit AddA n=1 Tax=Heyndrickxia sp. NPDC080065 TaxID=3390568 RepID=UPI003D09279E